MCRPNPRQQLSGSNGMKRLLIFVFFWGFLYAQQDNVVARVGGFVITRTDLERKMQDGTPQETALENLIADKLLLLYAKDNKVNVTDKELENYFANQFAGHPKFSTDGKFDYLKFDDLKNTYEVKRVLEFMRNDLLSEKARAMILSSIPTDDTVAMEKYIRDKTRLDLGYALFDASLVTAPLTATTAGARQFLASLRRQPLQVTKYQAELLFVPYALFNDEAFVSGAGIERIAGPKFTEYTGYKGYTAAEFLQLKEKYPLLSEQIDSLYSEIYLPLLKAKSQRAAYLARKSWQETGNPERPTLLTPYADLCPTFGNLPQKKEWEKVFLAMAENEISPLFEGPDGFFAFKKKKISVNLNKSEAPAVNVLWQEYLKHLNNDLTPAEYYRLTPDSLLCQAAFVNIAELNRASYEQKFGLSLLPELEMKIERQLGNYAQLETLAKEYHFKLTSEVIYLTRFTNCDSLLSEIKMKAGQKTGKIRRGGKEFLFYVTAIQNNYLPPYDAIKEQIPASKIASVDEKDYRDFYLQNLDSFTKTENYGIKGVIVPFDTTSIKVDAAEISAYYFAHENEFGKMLLTECLYIHDEDKSLSDYVVALKPGLKSFPSLRSLNKLIGSPQNVVPSYVEQRTLPSALQNLCKALPLKEISEPCYYRDGWYFVRILWRSPSDKQNLELVKKAIETTLKKEKVENAAKLKAQKLADRTTDYLQLASSSDDFILFEIAPENTAALTAFWAEQNAAERSFSTLTEGEKLSQVVKIQKGYAVVFAGEPSRQRQLSYQEALPEIKKKWSSLKSHKLQDEYAKNLQSELEKGEDPNELFYFLGGWHEIKGLVYGDTLQSLPYSDLVLRDAFGKHPGEVSRPVLLANGQYIIYRVDQLLKPKKSDFERDKEAYKTEIGTDKFNSYLFEYARDNDIIIEKNVNNDIEKSEE